MTTVFKSAPGFFSADSPKGDGSIPVGSMNIHTITFETFQLAGTEMDLNVEFTVLAAKAEDSPRQLKLLKQLRDHLIQNLGLN